MMISKQKSKLVSTAESVKAQIIYDLQMNVSHNDFFRSKFENDRETEKKVCGIIYKYNKNG